MPALNSPYVLPVLLLVVSNLFMTVAWYWHLRFTEVPIVRVILISWSLALIEYCFAVPANRIGARVYDPAALKTIQEVITLAVFVVFSLVYLRQPPSWHQLLGFGFIAVGAALVFRGPIAR